MHSEDIDFITGSIEPIVLTTAYRVDKRSGRKSVQLNVKICHEVARHVFGGLDTKLACGVHESGMFCLGSHELGLTPKKTRTHIVVRIRREFPDCIKVKPNKKAVIDGGYYYPGVPSIGFYVPESIMTFITDQKETESTVMNKSTRSVINGLFGVEQKVYEVIPITEPWTTTKMMAELKRIGHTIEDKTILRCARELVEKKLVIEEPKFRFKRRYADLAIHQIEERPMSDIIPTNQRTLASSVVQPVADEAKKSPMELLANLAARLRQFADDMDNAALEIEQEFQLSEAKSAQLKQLQTLLKTIAE